MELMPLYLYADNCSIELNVRFAIGHSWPLFNLRDRIAPNLFC